MSARPTDARTELARHAVRAVVIGGSAGAVDGMQRLLAALPAATAASVLVVIHLPAQAAVGVSEAFRDRTTLAVREAIDKESAAPGAVLFAPAGYHLLVERDGRLALSVDRPEHFSRPAIDVLFETAAAAFAPRLLGILLSGASEDGAAGMAAIRRAGGLAWAESPLVAAVPLMPSAALRDAPGTRALTIAEMADALGALPTHAPRAATEGAA